MFFASFISISYRHIWQMSLRATAENLSALVHVEHNTQRKSTYIVCQLWQVSVHMLNVHLFIVLLVFL